MLRSPHRPYSGGTSQQARAAIVSSLARRDPLIILIGDARSERTTLCRSIADGTDGFVSFVAGTPLLTFHDILSQLAAFAAAASLVPDDDLALAVTEDELARLIARGVEVNPQSPALLVVDDAHLVNRLVLAKLCALKLATNPGSVTVLLAGEPALAATLARPEFDAVNDRAGVRWQLGPAAKPDPKKVTAPPTAAGTLRRRRLVLLSAGFAAVLGVGWLASGVFRQSARLSPPARPLQTQTPPAQASAPTAPATTAAPAAAPAPPAAPPAAAPRETAAVPSPAPAAAPIDASSAAAREGTPRSAPALDAELERLHQATERRAIDLARRGDVDALLALKLETEKSYAQLGAQRPDFLAALLAELDDYLARARAKRAEGQRGSSRP